MEPRGPRGRRRTLASVVAESLSRRAGASRPAAAAAFAEACGWPLSRELTVRGLGPDGHLWVVASSPEWARQAEELSATIVSRMNGRLGHSAVKALDVRVRRDGKKG
ncbi:MAG: DciA family protein [Deltaproteobacteria bacterium]